MHIDLRIGTSPSQVPVVPFCDPRVLLGRGRKLAELLELAAVSTFRVVPRRSPAESVLPVVVKLARHALVAGHHRLA